MRVGRRHAQNFFVLALGKMVRRPIALLAEAAEEAYVTSRRVNRTRRLFLSTSARKCARAASARRGLPLALLGCLGPRLGFLLVDSLCKEARLATFLD